MSSGASSTPIIVESRAEFTFACFRYEHQIGQSGTRVMSNDGDS